MKTPIRLLQVAKSTAGVGEYVRWLAAGLDKNLFRLTVVCLSDGGPELASALNRIDGVRAFSLAMNRYQLDPIQDARACWWLARLIRREKFDLIHAHASKPGMVTRLAAWGQSVPVIYSPHCFAFHAGAGRFKAALVANLERFAAQQMTARILTVSEGERRLAERYHVGRADLFVTVHSGVDPAAYDTPLDYAALRASLNVPPEAPLVGSVGRLSPQKAPLDFVRAAAQVHAYLPEAHFVWVGAGPLLGDARALSHSLGLSGVFHFAGQRSDVTSVLRVFDCFVLPSRWEGLPLVVLEAMAASVPVVATNIPGTDELVNHGVNGLLVPPSQPNVLAEAILKLLGDREHAWKLGLHGRLNVERKFTRTRMIGGLTRVYQEVYEHTPPPRGTARRQPGRAPAGRR